MSGRITAIFGALQEKLKADLHATRKVFSHPLAKGEASEANWISMLADHVPERYEVTNGFVIDSKGDESDYIDVVIYDRQYTPLFYSRDNQRWIPAESVYAVFEAKQDLTKEHIEYAGAKAASVRRLFRTTAPVPYVEGAYKAKEPPRILAGILAYGSDWTPPMGDALVKSLVERPERERLDLGCAVAHGAFETTYEPDIQVVAYDEKEALIAFLVRLLARLQAMGTVPAIDYNEYARHFDGKRLL